MYFAFLFKVTITFSVKKKVFLTLHSIKINFFPYAWAKIQVCYKIGQNRLTGFDARVKIAKIEFFSFFL